MLDSVCPLCGNHPDTMWHRLWKCDHPDVVAIRMDLDLALVRRATEAGPSSLLYTRGWMVHPADAWPRPSNWDQCFDDMRFEAMQPDGLRAPIGDPDEWSCLRGS